MRPPAATSAPPKRSPVTRAEFATLEALTQKSAADAARALEVAEATYDKLTTLTDALMTPQAGHHQSLLDRMARVTIGFESGQRVGIILIFLATLCGAAIALFQIINGPDRP